MKLQKPSWINHDGHPIFSVDIQPNNGRFATGGQGADSMGRVVIWGLGSIEFPDEPNRSPMAKFLCQLDHHSACVNCVRWSNNGKYLASGGDDNVIMIWELKGYPNSLSNNQNSVFGKCGQEIWKPVATLKCHVGDILDLAWSPDDRYLASASVDNTVLIWDAQKFPRIVKEIQGHTSFVKGVTWDPVGSYLATQSDDKSLKIWRTSDWMLEHTVTDSFTECGGTTHVLRLDWSPDGGYLISAHAMNCGGPTAQIIERDGWRTDKDFVGHRKAVVCVRFTRTLHLKEQSQMCYVALGSRDKSVSVWSTALKRPLLVLTDVFQNSVMDLTWSSDGKMMMACSADGTVTVVTFSQAEIGDALSQEDMITLYQRHYGRRLNLLSNSAGNVIQNVEVFLARKKIEAHSRENPIPNFHADTSTMSETGNTILKEVPVVRGPTDKQIETRRADGKRRITPKFILPENHVSCPAFQTSEEVVFGEAHTATNTSSDSHRSNMVSGIEEVRSMADVVPLENPSATSVMELTNHVGEKKEVSKGGSTVKRITTIRLTNGRETDGNAPSEKSVTTHLTTLTNGTLSQNDDIASTKSSKLSEIQNSEGQGKTVASVETIMPNELPRTATKRKRIDESEINVCPPKKIQRPFDPIESIKKPTGNNETPIFVPQVQHSGSATQSIPVPQGKFLTPLSIVDTFISKVRISSGSSFQLEVNNNVRGTNWLKCQHEPTSFEGLFWTISTEAPICSIIGDSNRIAATCEDCSVHILNLKGHYVLPPYIISSLPSKICLNGAHLLIITIGATVHVWNIHVNKCIMKSESIESLLKVNSNKGPVQVYEATVMPNGSPLVILSSGKRFLFDVDMQSWILISEMSNFGPFPGSGGNCLDGSDFESLLTKRIRAIRNDSSITDIKLRLATAIQLTRPVDVQKSLVALAKGLAINGHLSELHILCEDLLGPAHSSAARGRTSWDPYLAGAEKRKALREILNVLLTDVKLQDFFTEFDEMLRFIEEG